MELEGASDTEEGRKTLKEDIMINSMISKVAMRSRSTYSKIAARTSLLVVGENVDNNAGDNELQVGKVEQSFVIFLIKNVEG